MSKPIYLNSYKKDEQTEELCLESIKQKPWNIQYVHNQTDRICLEAVSLDGATLQLVKNQTEEICLAAVKNFGMALQYVENQTEEICMAAVKDEGKALKFVENKTKDVCMQALKCDYLSVVYIMPDHPDSDELYRAAIDVDEIALVYAGKITDSLIIKSVIQVSKSKFLYKKEYFNSFFINKEHDCLFFQYMKNIYKDFKSIIEFEKNPINHIIDFMDSQPDDYITQIKNKIPEVFEENIELMSFYEKNIINKNINNISIINKDKNSKKF